MKKNGQSALEFISNYGWAVLIIMILGVIMAFYISRADMFGSDQCVLKAGFGCKEFEFTKSYIKVDVINSLGKNLASPVTATLTCNGRYRGGETPYGTETESYNLPVKNGANFVLMFPPLNSSDEKGSCKLAMKYTEDRYGAYEKTAEGTLRWKKITTEGTWPAEQCGWTGDDDWDGCSDDADSACMYNATDNYGEINLLPQQPPGFPVVATSGCIDYYLDSNGLGRSLDNDCDGAANCQDNSSGDCCQAYGPCFDPTQVPPIGFNPNDIQAAKQLWCICHDGRTTLGNARNGNPVETDMNCGGYCRTEYGFLCKQGQGCNENADCDSNKCCICTNPDNNYCEAAATACIPC